MKTIALLIILSYAVGVLSSIRTEFIRGNDLQEKELMIQQIETIAKFCESKSGSVDFEKGDLKCDAKKQVETHKAKPTAMPNVI